MIETKTFAQGENSSENTLAACSENAEMTSAQTSDATSSKKNCCLPSTSLSSTTISAVTYSAAWLSTRNPMSLTRSSFA